MSINVILAPFGMTITGQKRPSDGVINGGEEIEISLLKGEAFSLIKDTGESVWLLPIDREKPEIFVTGSTYAYLKRILSNF